MGVDVPPTATTAAVHHFRGWELRTAQRLLLVDGRPAKTGRPAYNLLLTLVQGEGRAVSKHELMAVVWPGRVVEENNLTVQITALRKLLGAQAIATVPGFGYRLESLRADTPAAGPPDTGVPNALALCGRDIDIQTLRPLLGEAPLLTIVGTGGVGKTSLARALLAQPGLHWRDGVHWIDLAPLRSPAPLLQRVAEALGMWPGIAPRGTEELLLSLAQRQALIALDNCEHLLAEVVAVLGPLLQRAPGIRWLATSQAPLRLEGETVYRLMPLELPAPGVPLARAAASGALALFCQRAEAADRRFTLDEAGLALAVDLCHRLDGLPLAIEMAAARVATLGLRGVHEQIDQRLRLRSSNRDAPARHHGLLQTFEWSYGLLPPVEQRVFRRLEAFADGFTAQMAMRLCCDLPGDAEPLDGWALLDALAALVDKSLVQRGPAVGAGGHGAHAARERLHLLESARDFARLRLDDAGEHSAVQRRHAEVVAAAFDTAQRDHELGRDDDWGPVYLPERRNVCVALAWACTDGSPDLLARLVAALGLLDAFAYRQAEVVDYPVPLEKLAAAAPLLRAHAHAEFGWAHGRDGDRELGIRLLLGALADFEALGDVAGRYAALLRLIRLRMGHPDGDDDARGLWQRLCAIDESQVPLRLRLACKSSETSRFDGQHSVERLQELHRIAEHAGFDAQAATCRLNITDELLRRGRFEEAAQTAAAMLQKGEPLPRVQALIRFNQAHALMCLGRTAEAREAAHAMLRVLPGHAHLVLDLFAQVAVQQGRHEDAALMAGCSAQVKRERHFISGPAEARVIDHTLAALHDAMGAGPRTELMQMGAGMAVADVLALAWKD